LGIYFCVVYMISIVFRTVYIYDINTSWHCWLRSRQVCSVLFLRSNLATIPTTTNMLPGFSSATRSLLTLAHLTPVCQGAGLVLSRCCCCRWAYVTRVLPSPPAAAAAMLPPCNDLPIPGATCEKVRGSPLKTALIDSRRATGASS
jgi:hypothetical protein